LKNELSDSTDSNEQLSSDLRSSNANLDQATASVEIQKALEEARSQFSSDEAEAYQQGGKLVIRMKNMNFSSGRSELPAQSLASLAKVMTVAKSLTPQSIQVEGHTDSTGTESANMQISEARAQAVATYFKSNGMDNVDIQSAGFGFQKPIATNKSKEGRTQNRRVDIVITPKTTVTE
jgi:outer membrane protein OmpA-like peptidoglycan-associated protein